MKRNGGGFFYLVMAAAAVVTVALVILLAPGAVPDTEPVALATAPAAAPPASPSADGTEGRKVVAVTPETVQSALATLVRADSYSRTLTVQRFWTGGSAASTVRVWIRGDLSRMSIRSGSGGQEKNILLRGDEKWIWYTEGQGLYTGAAAADEADRWQSLYSYERIRELDTSSIYDAGFVEFSGEDCIYVRFSDSVFGYESLCYISCATGLLMGEDVRDGDEMVYSMRSSPPDISTPDMAVFSTP